MSVCPHCGAAVATSGALSARSPVLLCTQCRRLFTPSAVPALAAAAVDLEGSTLLTGPVSPAARPDATEILELVLKVVRGPDTGRVFRVAGRELVVGRGAGDVRLDDPEVSRHHLAFQKLAGRCLARDLGSTNGSHVDGLKVAEAFVAVGQEIAVGNTVLKIEAIGGAHPAG